MCISRDFEGFDDENDQISISVTYQRLPAESEIAESEKKLFADLKVKSRLATFAEKVGSFYTVLTPVLFVNALRRFWEVHPYLLQELKNIKYYTCSLQPQVIEAVSYDGATVSTEAFGITTPTIFLCIAGSIFILGYEIKRYYKDKQKINELIELLAKTQEDTKNIRFLDVSRQQINELLHLIAAQQEPKETIDAILRANLYGISPHESIPFIQNVISRGIKDKVVNALTRPKETFINKITWTRDQLNSYALPVGLLAIIPGFVIMKNEADKVGETLHCNLWTYIADTCPIASQYDMLTLEIYPWMSVSVALLGFYSLGMLTRLLAEPFQKARSFFYDKIHHPYKNWCEDKNRWRIQNVTWGILSLFFLPIITGYSASQAIKLVNKYAELSKCESISNVMSAIFRNDLTTNPHCTASQMGIIISGFLGDFEIGKLYSLYMAAKLLSFSIGKVLEQVSYFKKENVIEKIDRLIDHLKTTEQKSRAVAMIGCIAAEIMFFLLSKQLADQVLREDLEVSYSLDDINLAGDINAYSNSTLSHLLEQVCPYDTLDFSNATIDANSTFPWRIVDNSTIAFLLAPACPQYGISSVFLHNLGSNIKDCSAVLVARVIGTFAGLNWTGVSTMTGGTYFMSKLLLSLSCSLNSLMNYLKHAENNSEEHNRREILPRSKTEKSCLSRAYSRFFKSPPVINSRPLIPVPTDPSISSSPTP